MRNRRRHKLRRTIRGSSIQGSIQVSEIEKERIEEWSRKRKSVNGVTWVEANGLCRRWDEVEDGDCFGDCKIRDEVEDDECVCDRNSSPLSLWLLVKNDKMGLSPYQSPSDAGVLCVILVNTAMSISIMKEIVRSILHVIGIHVTSWEDFSSQSLTESVERRGTPSESYMEEFRSRTPSLLYDSLTLSCRSKQECSVCLTEFKPDSEINRLSCGHVFHKSCLEKWLKYWNITCPLCRNQLMSKDEENTCPM
ncbi:hypothetical protein L1887_39661 [Cichorium endivia]|nr:hypothetical protein L1887_39661 [Cichorium endivia]